jgi:hypothetical protein
LRGEEDILALSLRLFDCAHTLFTTHEERNYLLWEHNKLAERKKRDWIIKW